MPIVCARCGSDDLKKEIWVDPNTNEFLSDGDGTIECLTCGSRGYKEVKEEEVLWTVPIIKSVYATSKHDAIEVALQEIADGQYDIDIEDVVREE